MAAAPPFVGPRECDGPAGALGKRRANLKRCQFRLAFDSFANAIGAGFSQQQREMTGHVLQAREISPEVHLAMEVDIEGADIEKRQVEIFRRRKVHVGEQAVRRHRFALVIQFVQELLDACLSMPAHDSRRNLVAERKHQDRWVTTQLRDRGDDALPDTALRLGVIEERDMLRPRDPDHDAQTGARSLVENRAAGYSVGANRVDGVRAHQRKIFDDLLQRREVFAFCVGCKRSVRDALRYVLFPSDKQKLPLTRNPP
jgi:hypothetical protein